jgi:ABC-type lipoprotein export system ATPase subunit
MKTLRDLNQRDGVTIVQVTHSEKQARYGDRIVRLVDGAVEEDVPVGEGTAVGS